MRRISSYLVRYRALLPVRALVIGGIVIWLFGGEISARVKEFLLALVLVGMIESCVIDTIVRLYGVQIFSIMDFLYATGWESRNGTYWGKKGSGLWLAIEAVVAVLVIGGLILLLNRFALG